MFTDIEPSSDPRLAAVFSAAKAPAELPLLGEAAALEAYRKAGRSRFSVRLSARPAQMVAAALFGGFLVAGGVATAATGSLPLPAVHQHHASHATVASTDDATTDAASTDDAASSATDMTDTGGPGTAGHPGVLGSVQKGIDTCAQASKDKCQAGQHGKALAAHDHHVTHSLPSAATTHRSSHAGAVSSGAAAHSHSLLGGVNGSLHRRG